MTLVGALVGALPAAARVVSAQTAADEIALGDRDHAALNAASALKHYEAAIALDPNNYTALVKAAHDAVDLGEFNPSDDQRSALYRSAEQYARRAVAANPNEADGHFELARAVGRNALTMGTRDRIKYAGIVYDEANAALKINPRQDGALHVLGEWNAEVMRLNGISRLIARNFLGGQTFGQASWDNAQKYLEESVAAAPARIVHHLDLAQVYADRGDRAKAVEQYDWIAKATPTDYNDRNYQRQAAERLKKLE